MKRSLAVSLALLIFLVFVSAVYAHFPGREMGFNCRQYYDADIEKVKEFRKDTLPLREEMVSKRLEMRQELQKETPDRDHIAKIQKEMIDIRTQIVKKADEAGLSLCGKGAMKHFFAKDDGRKLRSRHMLR